MRSSQKRCIAGKRGDRSAIMSGVHNTAPFLPAEGVGFASLRASSRTGGCSSHHLSFETALRAPQDERDGQTLRSFETARKYRGLLGMNGLSIGACCFTREGDFCLPNQSEMCTIQ